MRRLAAHRQDDAKNRLKIHRDLWQVHNLRTNGQPEKTLAAIGAVRALDKAEE
ncbi:MAG: hypothetical protein ACUVS7_18495 [Bryobacteraceae bacterium]